ncbi:MAG: 4a-hydroxytetrahydrobiopterin dehydratase [Planctomycetota bacterium]
MSRAPLTEAELAAALADLPHWRHEDGALTRSFRFHDFNEGLRLQGPGSSCSGAEREDHHPDWRNVWRDVEVHLSTHDAGAVTGRDLVLARRMDELAGDLRP